MWDLKGRTFERVYSTHTGDRNGRCPATDERLVNESGPKSIRSLKERAGPGLIRLKDGTMKFMQLWPGQVRTPRVVCYVRK